MVATGTPEDIAAVPDSHTGRFLAGILGPRAGAKSAPRKKPATRKPRAKVSA